MRKSHSLQQGAAILAGSLLMPAPAPTQAEPIFDYQIQYYTFAPYPIAGVTPLLKITYPSPGWPMQWSDPLEISHDNGAAVAIRLRQLSSPLDGAVPGSNAYEDRNTLDAVLSWIDSTDKVQLDYVIAEFEFGASTNPDLEQRRQENMLQNNANLRAVIHKIRSHANPNINTAKIGAFNYNGGSQLLTQASPAHVDRTPVDQFYRHELYNGTRALGIAMPEAYPFAYFYQHWVGSPGLAWGLEATPTVRGALFWAPLESVSMAKRNLEPGDLLIPWFATLVPNAGFPIAADDRPTTAEYRALVQHARLRGADSYVTWRDSSAPLDVTATKEYWDDLNWFFARSGTTTVLNTDTNKKTGLEWSGVRRGGRTLVLASNLSGASAAVPLATAIGQPVLAGLPVQSPQLPDNTHLLSQYLVTPSLDETFESYPPNVTMNNFGYGSNSAEWEVRPGPSGNTSLSLTRTAASAGAGYKTIWFKKAAPAFDTTDRVVYSVKMFSGQRTAGSIAGSGFGPCHIDTVLESKPGNVPNADRQGVFIEFIGGTRSLRVQVNMSGGRVKYISNDANLIAANTWYEVRIEVGSQANGGVGTVYLRNLAASGAPVAVHLDDVAQAGLQDVTEIPLFFADPALQPTQFNGWEVYGHNQTAYFDDFKAELAPTIRQFSGPTP